MRKVFLDDLPRWESGMNKGRINWMKAVGKSMRFTYDDITGEIKIIDYTPKPSRLTLIYDNEKITMNISNFLSVKLGNLLGKKSSLHSYKVGHEFNDGRAGKLLIVKNTRNSKNRKSYLCECRMCNNVSTIEERSLDAGSGCKVCVGNSVLKGYNDMWTTNPELASMLKDHVLGYQLAQNSRKKVDWVCSRCNNVITNKVVSSVNRQGLSCNQCSDGISYPEKFFYNFMKQTKLLYETQKRFQWSQHHSHTNEKLNGVKVYDGFIPKHNILIELHGKQHYIAGFNISNDSLTFEEIKENDRIKRELATENDVELIILDCSKSEQEHIKKSILESRLSEIINLENVNWLECHKYACNSIVKTVCDSWNEINNTVAVAKILGISKKTVFRYLKQGTELGWCMFDAKESIKRARKMQAKSVVALYDNGESILFESMLNAERETGVKTGSISKACRGKCKTAGGYKWMYKEDYEKYIEDHDLTKKT